MIERNTGYFVRETLHPAIEFFESEADMVAIFQADFFVMADQAGLSTRINPWNPPPPEPDHSPDWPCDWANPCLLCWSDQPLPWLTDE